MLFSNTNKKKLYQDIFLTEFCDFQPGNVKNYFKWKLRQL